VTLFGSVSAVLWDIDGTLLTSAGVAAQAFLDAVQELTGSRPHPSNVDMGGRIDPEIATLLLAEVGHDDALVPAVLARLEEIAAARTEALNEHTRALAGVRPFLDLLATANVRQTVVTGNVESIARLKLRAAGLIPPIDPDLGGFGDSGSDRVEVARMALRRLTLAGWPASPGTCWIVGDTPRDLACARALGLRCALIGSGRHPAASMAALGADVVLTDLNDPTPLLALWHAPR
jgi:phosphoglycolate phosphatase-like HAD superfamily hydrolase